MLRKNVIGILIVLIFLLTSITLLSAQSNDKYDLSWNALSSGGGLSKYSKYEVVSSIGQVVVGNSSHAKYEVSSGFFAGSEAPPVVIDEEYFIYLPSVIRP